MAEKKPFFIDIRDVVKLAKLVKQGATLTRTEQRVMALTVLQLHAGYERQRAELMRHSPAGTMRGPGEWWGFQSDDVPKYPTFIHTRGSGRWPDKDDDAEVQTNDRKDAVAAPPRVRRLRRQARARRR